jgi:hypothetical protein
MLTECQRGNRRREAWDLMNSLSVRSVPDVHEAITATGGKGAILRVEGDAVHRVHSIDAVYHLTMAFEDVFLLLDLFGGVKVLDGTSALNRTQRIA